MKRYVPPVAEEFDDEEQFTSGYTREDLRKSKVLCINDAADAAGFNRANLYRLARRGDVDFGEHTTESLTQWLHDWRNPKKRVAKALGIAKADVLNVHEAADFLKVRFVPQRIPSYQARGAHPRTFYSRVDLLSELGWDDECDSIP